MKRIIATASAPAAIGPYSQAVVSDGLVFVSGQIPLDSTSGRLVDGGIEEQSAKALANLKAVLEAAGSGLESVVKTTVFLIDLADFPDFNRIYSASFPSDPPARSTVQVARLPRDARVEIECIARVR